MCGRSGGPTERLAPTPSFGGRMQETHLKDESFPHSHRHTHTRSRCDLRAGVRRRQLKSPRNQCWV